MIELNSILRWDPELHGPDDLLRRESIVTNGLGGYASSTISEWPTREFHGLLVSALPAPLSRHSFLGHLQESVILPDGIEGILSAPLSEVDNQKTVTFRLKSFHLDYGLPVWHYEYEDIQITRRVWMLHGQNTVQIRFELVKGDAPLVIRLGPSIHFRPHNSQLRVLELKDMYVVTSWDNRFEFHLKDSNLPPLRLLFSPEQSKFIQRPTQQTLQYIEEQRRGCAFEGTLWSPGLFEVEISPKQPVTLAASTEHWETILVSEAEESLTMELARRRELISLAPESLQIFPAGELVLAADQFIIKPAARLVDEVRAHALGQEARSVIAGYHWFTEWGRDTMISLEGLALVTGRHNEARWILHTFAQHIRNGLIPNLFPEGDDDGLYHTADATLWFFQALSRYLDITKDFDLLTLILPKLREIISFHQKGTDFGIRMDSQDMLLIQGAPGYQLTWMDAKVGDWVVTPRRGKAVEINALWYNALRLTQEWLELEHDIEGARALKEVADRAYLSFNEKFWHEPEGYLFDVIEGEGGDNDSSFRPNQVFAIALTYPVLNKDHWAHVLNAVRERLLTPVGLRTLSRDHPDYKQNYSGDLRSRDAAYHQGTVWPWLIGPFIDAWLRTFPHEKQYARELLMTLVDKLTDAGIGTISEIFDAEPPYTPRGCIAQAWSVAEVLRSWQKTA